MDLGNPPPTILRSPSPSNRRFQFHAYEGHAFQKIMFPVRVMARLGIKSLVGESFQKSPCYGGSVFDNSNKRGWIA